MQNTKELNLNALFGLRDLQILPVPDLCKKITISEVIPKPSSTKNENVYEITLIESSERRKFSLGDKIYLENASNKLVFSSKPTDFGFKMLQRLDKKIRCQVFLEVDTSNVGISFKNEDFITEVTLENFETTKLSELKPKDPFFELSEAKWITRDCLFELIKDENYQKLAFKQRLLFSDYEVYFNENDWLIWKEGKWQVESLEKSTDVPLAHILLKTAEGIQVEGWDETGKKSYSFIIKKFSPMPVSNPPSKIFQSLRLKTKYQVTAQLGKKSFFLRVGDAMAMKSPEDFWLIKNYKMNGHFLEKTKGLPILTFEKIEKQNTKRFFVGFLFDPYHLQPISIRLPIEFSSTVKEEKQKKRAIFKNIEKRDQ